MHDSPPDNSNDNTSQPQFQPTPTSGAAGELMPTLDNDVIAEIVTATRAQPSWKACETENTSWDGTTVENTKKYLDITGR